MNYMKLAVSQGVGITYCFDLTKSIAACTVVIDSTSSSGISISNSSSKLMMSSTASSESAPRSSMKLALSSKAPSGFNWLLTSSRTRSSTPSAIESAIGERETTAGREGTNAEALATSAARTSDLAENMLLEEYVNEG